MTKSEFQVPQSVSDYLSDAATRTAVKALLQVSDSDLPSGLEWHELPDFYSARAAAELVRREWPIMLFRLWQAIWARIESDGWQPATPDMLKADAQYAVTFDQCWDDECFTVWHERGDDFLSTCVMVDPHETAIAFKLDSGVPEAVFGSGRFTRHQEGLWKGWAVASIPLSPISSNFDLDEFVRLVDILRDASGR